LLACAADMNCWHTFPRLKFFRREAGRFVRCQEQTFLLPPVPHQHLSQNWRASGPSRSGAMLTVAHRCSSKLIGFLSASRNSSHSPHLSPKRSISAQACRARRDGVPTNFKTPPPRPSNHFRGALPPHLPREEITVDVDDKTCPCCGGLKHRIGEDVSERLDVTPAQFKVLVLRRPK
jgi:hypothetical protein